MDTELNKIKKNNFKIFRTTAIVCLFALALSFAGCGKKAGASTASSATQTESIGDKIIANSENVPRISIEHFLTNLWKNTGIYKMIHNDTPEEARLAEESAKAVEAGAEDYYSNQLKVTDEMLLAAKDKVAKGDKKVTDELKDINNRYLALQKASETRGVCALP